MIKKRLNIDNQIIENSLRRFSNKSQGNIDVVSAANYIRNSDKYFYANENDNFIKLTRIKYPFEGFLPKFVFIFDKNNFQNYSIRPGILSVILFTFLIALFFLALTISIVRNEEEEIVINIFGIILLYLILGFIEYKISSKKINYIFGR